MARRQKRHVMEMDTVIDGDNNPDSVSPPQNPLYYRYPARITTSVHLAGNFKGI
jgi:hypothetical protein